MSEVLPMWMNDARQYYSQILPESRDSLTVFAFAKDQDVSSAAPGTPRLHLQRESPGMRVRTADGQDVGTVRFTIPGVKYVMWRGDEVVWTLSVRSWLRKHWSLEIAGSESWSFDTPFFWWQHLRGRTGDTPKLLGRVGPRKFLWFMWVQPGADTDDLLAALGVMHRAWWHS